MYIHVIIQITHFNELLSRSRCISTITISTASIRLRIHRPSTLKANYLGPPILGLKQIYKPISLRSRPAINDRLDPTPHSPILHPRLHYLGTSIFFQLGDHGRRARNSRCYHETILKILVSPQRHRHGEHLPAPDLAGGRSHSSSSRSRNGSFAQRRKETDVPTRSKESANDSIFDACGTYLDARAGSDDLLDLGVQSPTFGDDASRFGDGDVSSEGNGRGGARTGEVEEGDPSALKSLLVASIVIANGTIARGILVARGMGHDAPGPDPIVFHLRLHHFHDPPPFQFLDYGRIPLGSFSQRQPRPEIDSIHPQRDGVGPRTRRFVRGSRSPGSARECRLPSRGNTALHRRSRRHRRIRRGRQIRH
mmetsp:Transcript_21927/g.43839  ORF Transcript_21927/g.43839 Transcript_21927/m.43839 type:complete len:366 (-) Transcript_21927:175-1272(-)